MQTVKFACFNARSVCNKIIPVVELLNDHAVDICYIAEAWLKDQLDSVTHMSEEFGFNILHTQRSSRGGGNAVLFQKLLHVTKQKTDTFNTFEVPKTILQISNEQTQAGIRISSIYRTCGRNSSAKHLSKFFDEFNHYLSTLTSKPGFSVVCGNLNFHLEDQNNSSSASFQNLIDATGYIQHVSEPTHTTKGTPDVCHYKKSSRR